MAKRALGPAARALLDSGAQLAPATWGLERAEDGSLALAGVALAPLLERWGSPLFVVDAAALARNAAAFLARPPGAGRGCEVYYSYKTNPVPGVLARLHALGLGAEVISEYELWLALRLGVPPAQIIFNGPAKSPDALRVAIARGVGLINLNAADEVDVVCALARSLGRRARVGLRVVVGDAWAGQFGVTTRDSAAVDFVAQALAHPELEVVALHAHRGTELSDREQVRAHVRGVLALADEVRARLGLEFEVLDLGGSLACPTVRRPSPLQARLSRALGIPLQPRQPGAVVAIGEYTATVVAECEAHYRALQKPVPRLALEPGRAMTGNAQLLLCRVLSTKVSNGVRYAVLDAGMNVAEPAQAAVHQVFPVGAADGRARHLYRLAGPICTPADLQLATWRLPELAPGDVLAIMDAGAYFVPSSTQFSFPRPAIVMVEDGRVALLRRAEDFRALTAHDEVLGGAAEDPYWRSNTSARTNERGWRA